MNLQVDWSAVWVYDFYPLVPRIYRTYNEDEIGIETIQLMLASKFLAIDHVAETFTAVILEEDSPEGKKRAEQEAKELIARARKIQSRQ